MDNDVDQFIGCFMLAGGDRRASHRWSPAPELHIGKMVQGNFNPAEPNRATVIEFWGTWCGPCVANIPHMNDLARQFESRGVRFLSLTAEEMGTVATDPDQMTLKAYGAGTPTTVLIDRSGRVVRKIHPEKVTDTAIDDLASDRPVQLPAIRDDMYPPLGGGPFRESPSDQSTIVKVSVTPSIKQSGVNRMRDPWKKDSHMKADGATLPDLLGYVYDLSPYRVIVSKYLQGGRYAVDAWVPNDRGDLLKPMVRNALEAAIDYRPRMEQRSFEVLVLTGLPGKLSPVAGDLGQEKSDKGLIGADQLNLDWLRMRLEERLGKPVVIDNMPTGNYKWRLQWDEHDPDGLTKALREQAGLQLHPERRTLSVVVVDTASSTVAAAAN